MIPTPPARDPSSDQLKPKCNSTGLISEHSALDFIRAVPSHNSGGTFPQECISGALAPWKAVAVLSAAGRVVSRAREACRRLGFFMAPPHPQPLKGQGFWRAPKSGLHSGEGGRPQVGRLDAKFQKERIVK